MDLGRLEKDTEIERICGEALKRALEFGKLLDLGGGIHPGRLPERNKMNYYQKIVADAYMLGYRKLKKCDKT